MNSSAYASITGSDEKKLHIMVLNINYTDSVNFNFNINSSSNYSSGRVWGFDSSSAEIKEMPAVSDIRGNKFTYSVPPLTALHFVLDTQENVTPTPKPCLYLSSVTSNPGEDVTLKLTAKDMKNVAGIKANLKYDPSKLSVKSMIFKPVLSLNAVNTTVPGEIYFNGLNSKIPSELIPLELPINIVSMEACDVNAKNISTSSNDGKITVVQPILPVTDNVTFTGECVNGQTLTASYTYSDGKNRPESGTKFRWLAADHGTENFTEIPGAVDKTFVVTKDYVGKDIKVEVTPTNSEVTGIAATGNSKFNTVILKGDVNRDGKVNFLDALLMISSISGTFAFDRQQLVSANVDGTKGITVNDVILVLEADVGLVSLN